LYRGLFDVDFLLDSFTVVVDLTNGLFGLGLGWAKFEIGIFGLMRFWFAVGVLVGSCPFMLGSSCLMLGQTKNNNNS